MSWCRYGDACTAVITLTAAGVAQTFVLAGDVQPSFAQGFPACQLSGNTLVATQQEVSLHARACRQLEIEQAPGRGGAACMQLRLHLCHMQSQLVYSISRPSEVLRSSSINLHSKGLLPPHVLTETVDHLCATAHWQLLREAMWLLMWSQLPQLFGADEASAPACIP